jgi:hypothetical protein
VTKGGFLERAGLVSSQNRNAPVIHSAALNMMKKQSDYIYEKNENSYGQNDTAKKSPLAV